MPRSPRFLRAIALGLVSGVIACSDSPTVPIQPTEVGSYQLLRIDGLVLPAPFPVGGSGVTATGGTLVLTATKEWTANVAVLVVAGEVNIAANQIMSGSYTRTADTVFLRDVHTGAVARATLGVTTLSVRDDSTLYEFARR